MAGHDHGRTFGIAPVTSISRSIPPATSPSRTQSSACHQSSYPRLAEAICSRCGRQVTGQASNSTVRHLPRVFTQIVAAERAGRRYFAMELDPVYCDVAVRRWEMATGRKAMIPAH